MLLKSKAIVVIAALLLSYGIATKASAIGSSYEFSANDSSTYWDLSAYSSSTQKTYFLDDPFFEFDPAENFQLANETVSGQFSYDSSASLTHSSSTDDGVWSFTRYDAENLGLNLVSASGVMGHFDVPSPHASVSINNVDNRKYFFASGWGGTDPPITLSGDGGGGGNGCGIECGEFFTTSLPVGQLREDRPDLFDNVDFIDVEVFGFDSSSGYELQHVSLGHRADALPADGSLPTSLSPLSEENNAWLSLDFSPADFPFLGLDVFDIQTTDGNSLSQEQEDGIFEFISDLYVDLSVNVRYDVTELTQLATGVTPHNPILPDPGGSMDEGFDFTFDAPEDSDEFTFIDPDVAVGYDYEVTGGASFSAVLLPEDIGDNLFDLWLFDDILGDFVDSGIDLTGGVPYTFDPEVDLFRILGIETSEFLDPTDATAFVTGLQFLTQVGTTSISMSQTPITEFVDVPTPTSGVFLLVAGITGMFTRRRGAGRV